MTAQYNEFSFDCLIKLSTICPYNQICNFVSPALPSLTLLLPFLLSDSPLDSLDSGPSSKRTAGCFSRLFGPANGPKSGVLSRAGCMKSQDDRTMLLSDILEVSKSVVVYSAKELTVH
jgi:hypothetical protein